MSKKHNPNKQGVLSQAVSPPKTPTIDAFELSPGENVKGPLKGEFVPPPEVIDNDERADALPEQEDFWRPPVRFGSVPVEKEPLGWDRRRGFRKLFPVVSLPTQVVERVPFGHPQLEPNRLFWGDNLHVMRQLPTESIDLIYIDPPFFSGRQYNVIFGDQNELRSFSDIWEGGMPGYLIWLNARLFEMKRLLKKTGSIYVHLDWHASHYVKIEMDRIFYKTRQFSKRYWNRKHDDILFYTKSNNYTFNWDVKGVLEPYDPATIKKYKLRDEKGLYRLCGRGISGSPIRSAKDVDPKWEITNPELVVRNYLGEGYAPSDHWQLDIINQVADERIGYPTQKPETLLGRIIKASSNEGDVVADFFCGGGTTAAVAQCNKRQWIACDQSRVAVALTADRISKLVEQGVGSLFEVPDLTIEHWGIYEAERLSKMPVDQFRAFIVRAFGAVPEDVNPHIHGFKGAIPVWVGEPNQRTSVSAKDVEDFANATRKTIRYQQDNLRDGTMLAWAFRPDAVKAAERLREMEQTELNFIRLEQIRIDSPTFREHIVALSTDHADYENFLTFVQPPKVEVGWKRISARNYKFDVSETAVLNAGAKIINVQWDFSYDKRFSSTPGYSFIRGTNKETLLQLQYEFPRTGKFRIACKVQDDMGGEGLWSGEVEVS
jgi:DNA modification methylase